MDVNMMRDIQIWIRISLCSGSVLSIELFGLDKFAELCSCRPASGSCSPVRDCNKQRQLSALTSTELAHWRHLCGAVSLDFSMSLKSFKPPALQEIAAIRMRQIWPKSMPQCHKRDVHAFAALIVVPAGQPNSVVFITCEHPQKIGQLLSDPTSLKFKLASKLYYIIHLRHNGKSYT